jgi:hypothetical protein
MHVSVHVLLHFYADEMMMLVDVVVEVKVNLMEASAMESKGEVYSTVPPSCAPQKRCPWVERVRRHTQDAHRAPSVSSHTGIHLL